MLSLLARERQNGNLESAHWHARRLSHDNVIACHKVEFCCCCQRRWSFKKIAPIIDQLKLGFFSETQATDNVSKRKEVFRTSICEPELLLHGAFWAGRRWVLKGGRLSFGSFRRESEGLRNSSTYPKVRPSRYPDDDSDATFWWGLLNAVAMVVFSIVSKIL